MKAARDAFVALVVSAAVGWVPAVSVPGAEARAAAETAVDPTALERGGRPTVPYLLPGTKVIRDGQRRVEIRYPGRAYTFHKVNRGYLLSGYSDSSGAWLAVYGYGGHGRVLARARTEHWSWNEAVSPDGRRVAYRAFDNSGAGSRLVVRHVWAGPTLERTFRRPTRIVAFGDRRLLLSRGLSRPTAVWWSPGRSRLERYARGYAQDADLGARQIVMRGETGRRVLSVPRTSRPVWRMPGNGFATWSTDDRRIAYLAGVDEQHSLAFDRLEVVSHAGARLRRFTGHFASDVDSPDQESPGLLRWESRRRFLVEAYTLGSDGTLDKGAVVRCWVGGRCRRASGVYDVPRSGGAPYLLARPRTG